MKNIRHILFYSRADINQDMTIRQVRQLCLAYKARLTLMTVLKEPSNQWSFSTSIPQAAIRKKAIERGAQSDLLALAAEMREKGISTEICVEFGKPFVQVIRRVQSRLVDLVVLGANADTRLRSQLIASIALHLIRKCPCPVWAVRPGRGDLFQNVMAAVDLSQDDEVEESARNSLNPSIAHFAKSVSQKLGARLHIVQACQVEHEGYLQVRGGLDSVTIDRMNEEMVRTLRSRLDHFCKQQLGKPLPEYHPHVEHGAPATVISEVVARKDIDLLVMGTMSRSGIAGFLIGNTAEEVLQLVDCSVLALKPPGFQTPVKLTAP